MKPKLPNVIASDCEARPPQAGRPKQERSNPLTGRLRTLKKGIASSLRDSLRSSAFPRLRSGLPLVVGLLAMTIVFSGCSLEKAPYQEMRVLLGTCVTIKIADTDKTAIEKQQAANAAFGEIKRIEEKYSSFKKGNIIGTVNNSNTEEVLLDEETFYILNKAKYFNEVSNGAFDITVKPLLELWGFHRKTRAVPDASEVKMTLGRVGSDKMILDGEKKSVRFTESGMKIDLGGIGKGYAADRAIEILKGKGIRNALVSCAGDIRAIGKRIQDRRDILVPPYGGVGKPRLSKVSSRGKRWSIGIRDPLDERKIIKKVELEDMAISTSGSYENFFEVNGKRFSHIIDPKTGSPVENNLLSVTIIAKDSTTADALATAVTVLGKERGVELINRLGIEAILVSSEDGGIKVNRISISKS